ncbi:MAG: HDIG domain-containing protein [Clostridia bacterium]|nr:HDIG domain-containing protein [Clostridia bacterium]
MKLNFSSEEYKEKARLSSGYGSTDTSITVAEAFMQLIKGVPKEDLSNLCEKIQYKLKGEGELTLEACYNITQGNIEGIDELISMLNGKTAAEYVLELAYECLDNPLRDEKTQEEIRGCHLGEKRTKDGKFVSSSWISHSLYEARVAQHLAQKVGLDSRKAGVMALLHDYGRKPTEINKNGTHDFTHVIKGFEMLTDLGWEAEARACLTHSFINAGRCANCDSAEPGFYIDEKGEPAWEANAELDDVTEVLSGMQYDEYDIILNIADLMATDKGITTPYDRVLDVATRKTPDPKNRAYFLSEFTNELLEVMQSSAQRSNSLMSIEEADKRLKKVSSIFYKFLYPEKDIETTTERTKSSLDEI